MIFTLLLSFTVFAQPLELPENGALVGAYVEAGPLSDEVSPANIFEFEQLINKKLSWVYFSNNWLEGNITFPKDNVLKAVASNVVPYIRLMPWSEVRDKGADPVFTMDAFLSGRFDEQLKTWAEEALKIDTPYILEFGPEVNGNWFAWNGYWNGRGEMSFGDPNQPDGPEKFKLVYQKIVTLFREAGLTNVTWVWHVDSAWSPHAWWNEAHYYYPGDDYVDWVGLSVFGAQLPNHEWLDFYKKIKNFWSQIESITQRKPVIISEFAVIEDHQIPGRKADWLERALHLVESQRYPIKAITYWNSSGWLADGSADFRLTSSEEALEAFKNKIQDSFWKVLPQPRRDP